MVEFTHYTSPHLIYLPFTGPATGDTYHLHILSSAPMILSTAQLSEKSKLPCSNLESTIISGSSADWIKTGSTRNLLWIARRTLPKYFHFNSKSSCATSDVPVERVHEMVKASEYLFCAESEAAKQPWLRPRHTTTQSDPVLWWVAQ